MTIELTVLALGCILGIVQIFIASELESRQYGMKWSLSSREDKLPPPKPLVGRLKRAYINFLETFPIAAAAILIIETADLNSGITAAGSMIWIMARVAFWIVYAIGIPTLRSIMFAISIIGIGMTLWPALF